MTRRFTKYPSGYVKASEEPYGYGRPLFDKQYEYERLYGRTCGFSFDFIAPNGYDETDIEAIVEDAFIGCIVNNIEFRSVEYPNWQSDYPSEPVQVGVAFTYDITEGYNYEDIIDEVEDGMKDCGYEVIGNPEFECDD